jgi:tyrosinase
MHGAGHYAIGGDAGDFFSSPNDPVFFMHHSMLDRLWWIWQATHLNQANTIAGTMTPFNKPPSREATLEDIIQMNYLDLDALTLKDLLSTVDGSPLCYIYL